MGNKQGASAAAAGAGAGAPSSAAKSAASAVKVLYSLVYVLFSLGATVAAASTNLQLQQALKIAHILRFV